MENPSAKNQNGGIFSGKYSGEQATENLKFRVNAGSFFLSCGFLAGQGTPVVRQTILTGSQFQEQ